MARRLKVNEIKRQKEPFKKLSKFQKQRLQAIVGKPTTSLQRQKEFRTYRLNNLQRTRMNIEKHEQFKAMRLNQLPRPIRNTFEPRGFGR